MAMALEDFEDMKQSLTTSDTAPATPQDRLFGVAELLENVLLGLPLRDLLLSQRVCRTWRGNVKQSSMIQRALFLKPSATITMISHLVYGSESKHEIHEIHRCRDTSTEHTLPLMCRGKIFPTLNPLASEYLSEHDPFCRLRLTSDELLGQIADSTSSASIGNMYLTHPPMREAWLHCKSWAYASCCHQLRNEAGLTVKDLVTQIKDRSQCEHEVDENETLIITNGNKVDIEELCFTLGPQYDFETDGWTMLETLERSLDDDTRVDPFGIVIEYDSDYD
ncbi:hypothetical protein LTR56_012443 [Elasticomyces elasticus]|nr:hypothetical protein LTR22_020826 [Elasticomyces elasticus]KAK3639472.1 hypothetical protein LTR56_012443 [Elasticomyces elasticus]KAK4909650.1 hypothetical protein LTR49_021624 [Elasticomyces elasticus]KAK5752734.1 hypothetical protein LTS12_017206 [Elasticomyces elasticus]